LQDARLSAQGNSSVRNEASVTQAPVRRRRTISAADAARARWTLGKSRKARPQSLKGTGHWVENNGFASAQTLVDLIDAKGTTPKHRR
jgi:hypothetical protein